MTSKMIQNAAGWIVKSPQKTAVDALEQLKAVEKTPGSIILSDIEMPRMDGYELAASLQAIRKNSNPSPSSSSHPAPPKNTAKKLSKAAWTNT